LGKNIESNLSKWNIRLIDLLVKNAALPKKNGYLSNNRK